MLTFTFRSDGALFSIDGDRGPAHEERSRWRRASASAGYQGRTVPLQQHERDTLAWLGVDDPTLAPSFTTVHLNAEIAALDDADRRSFLAHLAHREADRDPMAVVALVCADATAHRFDDLPRWPQTISELTADVSQTETGGLFLSLRFQSGSGVWSRVYIERDVWGDDELTWHDDAFECRVDPLASAGLSKEDYFAVEEFALAAWHRAEALFGQVQAEALAQAHTRIERVALGLA